nr:hypothetical protein Iba_chr14cCG15910 [Ipomoea batatas]
MKRSLIKTSMKKIFSSEAASACLPQGQSCLCEMDLQASSLPPSNLRSTTSGTSGPVSRCQLSFKRRDSASSMAFLAIWGRPVLMQAAIFRGISPTSSSHRDSMRSIMAEACSGVAKHDKIAMQLPKQNQRKSILAGLTFPMK